MRGRRTEEGSAPPLLILEWPLEGRNNFGVIAVDAGEPETLSFR
jgi:hypothetical protein